ncbi:hypothetical protein C4D60_Mb05t09080 [Musa balbisiana]|uniref:O-fucosyltransferase family protein n=1 Tax=Musa balbisiana TaxID=52838 RepID=A0A4S8JUS3_MUSBA|nr:hypothetical protein C4D60_Mb05t09080 [Musa balbisiana]
MLASGCWLVSLDLDNRASGGGCSPAQKALVGWLPTLAPQRILPLIKKHKVVHFNRTDARLANNGLPSEIQKLRCRVNYAALRFTSQIEELGRRTLIHFRFAYPWWKEKVINSEVKRKDGLCPLTPEEIALILKALDIDHNIQVYIAAGEIYGGERRMAALSDAYPNVVRKELLLGPSDLRYFQNHLSQMAALDYMVSLESDIFVPTYDGNMAKVVEGHRRYCSSCSITDIY